MEHKTHVDAMDADFSLTPPLLPNFEPANSKRFPTPEPENEKTPGANETSTKRRRKSSSASGRKSRNRSPDRRSKKYDSSRRDKSQKSSRSSDRKPSSKPKTTHKDKQINRDQPFSADQSRDGKKSRSSNGSKLQVITRRSRSPRKRSEGRNRRNHSIRREREPAKPSKNIPTEPKSHVQGKHIVEVRTTKCVPVIQYSENGRHPKIENKSARSLNVEAESSKLATKRNRSRSKPPPESDSTELETSRSSRSRSICPTKISVKLEEPDDSNSGGFREYFVQDSIGNNDETTEEDVLGSANAVQPTVSDTLATKISEKPKYCMDMFNDEFDTSSIPLAKSPHAIETPPLSLERSPIEICASPLPLAKSPTNIKISPVPLVNSPTVTLTPPVDALGSAEKRTQSSEAPIEKLYNEYEQFLLICEEEAVQKDGAEQKPTNMVKLTQQISEVVSSITTKQVGPDEEIKSNNLSLIEKHHETTSSSSSSSDSSPSSSSSSPSSSSTESSTRSPELQPMQNDDILLRDISSVPMMNDSWDVSNLSEEEELMSKAAELANTIAKKLGQKGQEKAKTFAVDDWDVEPKPEEPSPFNSPEGMFESVPEPEEMLKMLQENRSMKLKAVVSPQRIREGSRIKEGDNSFAEKPAQLEIKAETDKAACKHTPDTRSSTRGGSPSTHRRKRSRSSTRTDRNRSPRNHSRSSSNRSRKETDRRSSSLNKKKSSSSSTHSPATSSRQSSSNRSSDGMSSSRNRRSPRRRSRSPLMRRRSRSRSPHKRARPRTPQPSTLIRRSRSPIRRSRSPVRRSRSPLRISRSPIRNLRTRTRSTSPNRGRPKSPRPPRTPPHPAPQSPGSSPNRSPVSWSDHYGYGEFHHIQESYQRPFLHPHDPYRAGSVSPKRMALDHRIAQMRDENDEEIVYHQNAYGNYIGGLCGPPPLDEQVFVYPEDPIQMSGHHTFSNLIEIKSAMASGPMSQFALQKGNVLEIVPKRQIPTVVDSPVARISKEEQEKQDALKTEQRLKRKQERDKLRLEKFMRKEKLKLELQSLLEEEISMIGGNDEAAGDDGDNPEDTAESAFTKAVYNKNATVGKSCLRPEESNEETTRKKVLFSDGIRPGDGTSPSDSDDTTPLPLRDRNKKAMKKRLDSRQRKKLSKLKKGKKGKTAAQTLPTAYGQDQVSKLVIEPELENMPPPSPPEGDPPPNLLQPTLRTAHDNEHVPRLIYFHYHAKDNSMYLSPFPKPLKAQPSDEQQPLTVPPSIPPHPPPQQPSSIRSPQPLHPTPAALLVRPPPLLPLSASTTDAFPTATAPNPIRRIVPTNRMPVASSLGPNPSIASSTTSNPYRWPTDHTRFPTATAWEPIAAPPPSPLFQIRNPPELLSPQSTPTDIKNTPPPLMQPHRRLFGHSPQIPIYQPVPSIGTASINNPPLLADPPLPLLPLMHARRRHSIAYNRAPPMLPPQRHLLDVPYSSGPVRFSAKIPLLSGGEPIGLRPIAPLQPSVPQTSGIPAGAHGPSSVGLLSTPLLSVQQIQMMHRLPAPESQLPGVLHYRPPF